MGERGTSGLCCHWTPYRGQSEVYKDILRRFICSVREKRWELWQDKSWLLRHDKARAHTAQSIRQFMAEKNNAELEQPLYLTDLDPCDVFLFPELEGMIKRTLFEGLKATKRAVTTELRGIQEKSIHLCIEAWQRRRVKCIRPGDYFEGGTMYFVVWNWNTLIGTPLPLLFRQTSK